MNTQITPLSVLVIALRHAKLAEASANAARLEIERQIVTRFPAPATGEGMHKDAEFSITYKVTRSVDTDALQAAWATLGTNAQKAFKWSADLDLKAYRALVEMDPDNAFKAQSYITTKPAKPSLTLKDQS